jgi:uncharacterized lipoprotein YmbA
MKSAIACILAMILAGCSGTAVIEPYLTLSAMPPALTAGCRISPTVTVTPAQTGAK